MLKKGQVIDRYRVEDLLGSGGMATVYRVRHNQLNSLHALKMLFITSPEVRRRLIREGRVQASLRHPNIVAVTDVLEVEGVPALLMEYVDGPVMDEWLFANTPSFNTALRLFRGILLGVAHAHSHGVVHRDLKTANILLAKTNDGLFPRVMDFGLMKAVGETKSGRDATRGGMAMGTPNYMSPEQITDASTVDERTDIFALGCILYELFAGKHAFVGDNPWEIYGSVIAGKYIPIEEVVPDVPDNVRQAIEGCLKTDRDERLKSCDELFDLLYERHAAATASPGEATLELAFRLKSLDGSIPRAPALGSLSGASLDSRFDTAEQRFAESVDFEQTDSFGPDPQPADDEDHELVGPSNRRWPSYVALAALFVVAFLGGRMFFGGAPAAQPYTAPVAAPGDVVDVTPPIEVPVPSVQDDPVDPVPVDPNPAAVLPKPVRLRPKPPTMATVTVKGDAEEVRLKSSAAEYQLLSSTSVPAGTYEVYAVFPGNDALLAGWVDAKAGRKINLTCSSSNLRCTHK